MVAMFPFKFQDAIIAKLQELGAPKNATGKMNSPNKF